MQGGIVGDLGLDRLVEGDLPVTVDAGSAESLAKGMQTLADDNILAKKMGVASRCRFDNLFTGAQLDKSYGDLYRGLLNC